MQVVGLHPVSFPFRGHGVLTLDGKSTLPLRGLGSSFVLEQINALGVATATLDADGRLVLEADKPVTIGGNQDVLDVIGITAGPG